jgi:hypothetical protein
MNTFVEELGSSLGNIKIAYDFMDKQDLLSIKESLDNVSLNNKTDKMHLKENIDFDLPKDVRLIIEKYDPEIVRIAEDLYQRKFIDGDIKLLSTIHTIGSWSHPHTDILEAGLGPQQPDSPEFVGWRDAWDGYLACNIYINDNYEGGEVYFPEQNDYMIKPTANSAAFWAGNKYFIHGVKDPLTADRYTLTRWIKFVDFDKYNQVDTEL